MAEFGFECLPPQLKSDSVTLKWMKARSYRYQSKQALNKFHYGLADMSTISVKHYKNMLILSGEDKIKAQEAAAKLYLKRQQANA